MISWPNDPYKGIFSSLYSNELQSSFRCYVFLAGGD
jgi:hypothetical protein